MRILLVMPFLPYPPTDGGRIGFFNPIKYLSRNHELGLVTMDSGPDDTTLRELGRYCSLLKIHKFHPTTGFRAAARGLLGFPPGTSAKFWDPAFGKQIRDSVEEFRPNIVEFHHLNTAAYGRFVNGVPKILREHNVEYKIWERHAKLAGSFLERIYVGACAGRVKAFEGSIATTFDRCITVSEADTAFLRDVAPESWVSTIPSGVDTEYFYPAPNLQTEVARSLVLTGSFEWKPKQHNLRMLLANVFPKIQQRIPDVKLYVVGKGVPADIRQHYESNPGVIITGMVDDVRPYIEKAAVVLNYVESGGGIALKVLEAMAMRKAVLSNSLGCEGISVEHGKNVFLADGVDAFAEAAVTLLSDRELRTKLATQGYDLIQRQYAWNVIANQFSCCYTELLEYTSGTFVSRNVGAIAK